MTSADPVGTDDRRGSGRRPAAADVTVVFDGRPLVGPSENLSREGVFFVAEGSLRVRVKVGDGEWIEGEVVRAQSMGDGKVGVAVKFV